MHNEICVVPNANGNLGKTLTFQQVYCTYWKKLLNIKVLKKNKRTPLIKKLMCQNPLFSKDLERGHA
jgi:hypothetical protein